MAITQRRRHGLPPLQPRDDLGYGENFLYMTLSVVPGPVIVARPHHRAARVQQPDPPVEYLQRQDAARDRPVLMS
ncbi:hypothetical protein ACWDKQ_27265 [Saccharopolyspora sp. NPDC000995]